MLDALCQPSFNIGGVFFEFCWSVCLSSILRQGGGGIPIFSLDRNPEVTFGPNGSVAHWRMEEDGGGNTNEFLRTRMLFRADGMSQRRCPARRGKERAASLPRTM